MKLIWLFLLNSVMMGFCLAADAFAVSVVNGINFPNGKRTQAVKIAGAFAIFQAIMPLLGWILANTITSTFGIFEKIIPWLAQAFLWVLSIKMILESKRKNDNNYDMTAENLSRKELFIQAIATSIDALLIGLIIARYNLLMVFICAVIIAIITFVLCYIGVHFGRKVGLLLVKKATFVSGVILMLLAIEHFIKNL